MRKREIAKQKKEKIEEVLESEITRGNCDTCPKNIDGYCDVTEEKIGR